MSDGNVGRVFNLTPPAYDPAPSTAKQPVFVAQPAPPEDEDILWIDTTANTGGLKYYNGSAWVAVPVMWG